MYEKDMSLSGDLYSLKTRVSGPQPDERTLNSWCPCLLSPERKVFNFLKKQTVFPRPWTQPVGISVPGILWLQEEESCPSELPVGGVQVGLSVLLMCWFLVKISPEGSCASLGLSECASGFPRAGLLGGVLSGFSHFWLPTPDCYTNERRYY